MGGLIFEGWVGGWMVSRFSGKEGWGEGIIGEMFVDERMEGQNLLWAWRIHECLFGQLDTYIVGPFLTVTACEIGNPSGSGDAAPGMIQEHGSIKALVWIQFSHVMKVVALSISAGWIQME